VYLSESGGEPRVPARTHLIDIYDNTFEDNWSGITAWENADRFCNSPANTSINTCTKLVTDRTQCSAPGIEDEPLYDDCRWKTQLVEVHDNTFRFDPVRAGCTNGMCGKMALLSNYGTYPSWSPYKATVVQDAITHDQDNYWFSNSYYGPWKFVAGGHLTDPDRRSVAGDPVGAGQLRLLRRRDAALLTGSVSGQG
jgi:hypothetical protein